MGDSLKNLTGKNPKDFEPVAFDLINKPDEELFCELVNKDDFLFDFVKQNVASRLSKVCNENNYLNLLQLLKYYSPSYEEFIISTLVRFADETLTEKMFNILKDGTDNEKTYCAKFFSYINEPRAVELLKKYSFSENTSLATNCASTLGVLKEKSSYDEALTMLTSNDEFTVLDGVKFLVSYGEKAALDDIMNVMKTSSFAENIAGEILYLTDLFDLYKKNRNECLYTLNLIISGLGEILSLAQVFDFRLFDFLEFISSEPQTSASAVVLVNAADKFETLTENNEYLFDETKETKQEILDIKQFLLNLDLGYLYGLIDDELRADSLFVYTALEYTENEQMVRSLLVSDNQTVVLKSLEVLKQIDEISQTDKETALKSVTDENLKNIILAI